MIGDGEDVMTELNRVILERKEKGLSRETCLKNLAKLEGVYVPSLYNVEYLENGKIASVKPNCPEAPESVRKRVVTDLNNTYYPEELPVPYTEIVFDRIRSNDVIPEIMGRAGSPKQNEKAIEKPTVCPACGRPLIERGAHLFCMNRESCRPQAVARLAHFAGREAMDIEGFSEKTAGQLYDQMGIRQPADLYSLTPMDFLMLEGFKEKKAGNLSEALEKSKHCELDAFLFALGIPNVGRKTARDLAQRFGTLEKLKKADENALTAIPDIGDIVASSVTEYFSFPENIQMIERLLAAGVNPREMEAAQQGVFSGMTIVVTGTLPTLSRKQAEDLIRSRGGNASGSVSKKTAFVVVGEDAGSKLTKALSLGIETIREDELLKRAGI